MAPAYELVTLVHEATGDTLDALLDNPHLTEQHLILLLERKGLPAAIVERIARHRDWMRSYPVTLRVAAHPRTPRLLAIPLLRKLYLFDLVEVSLQPSTPAELKRLCEELLIARLGQLPLGQKLTLARRGSARVAGALLAEGLPLAVPLALDNPYLTESQVLKVLAREDLPEAVPGAIAAHRKWSLLYNVRIALVRHPHTPLARTLAFLPDLTLRDLADLVSASAVPGSLRQYLQHETARRVRKRPLP
jgi:hypothetical protein